MSWEVSKYQWEVKKAYMGHFQSITKAQRWLNQNYGDNPLFSGIDEELPDHLCSQR